MMALYDDLYGTPAPAAPAATSRRVAPVVMPQPAAAAAPDPLVAAMQSMKAGAVAPADIASASLPRQAGESPRAYDQRQAIARTEADKAAREAIAPAKKRDLPSGEVEKITAIDNSLGTQMRLLETFKPEYGGYKAKFAGDLANTYASTFGGDKEAQADWWKSYDSNDNLSRAATYGSTLTAGETAAWKRTTVDISMTPQMIERRMKERAALIEAKRKNTLENLGKANFNVENFQAAPSNFSPAPVAAPPVAALKEGHVTTFKNGQQWTLTNGKPEKVN
jgi:hypothetical protein